MADRGLLFLLLLHCLAFLASAQEVNVAAGKPADASSEFKWGNYPASSVTDGETQWDVGKCYHSDAEFPNDWLRVYLGAVYPMNKIVIYYRNGYSYRFLGTTINILNSAGGPAQYCTTVTNSSLNYAALSGTFSCATAGSIVELRRDGEPQNICEVQVWVCSAGSYGVNCTGRCGQCAQGVTCDHVTGDCPAGCQPGWKAPGCRDKCDAGSYGAGCGQTCGHCTQGTTCDHVTGDCSSGCQPGWKGPGCTTPCSAGRYGANCNNTCGSCRDNAVCNLVTGNCPGGCSAGWGGLHCLQECSDGTYGEGCTVTCGNCAGGVACDKKDGPCTACQQGFTLPLCKADIASMSGLLSEGSAYQQGLGTGIGIGIGIGVGVSCLVVLTILTILFLRRRSNRGQGNRRSKEHGARSGKTRNADNSVHYNAAQEEAEVGDKAPYETLDAATCNTNLPNHYEEIRNN